MSQRYPFNNFYEMLEANAASHPKRPVIFIDDGKVTHAQFLKKVDAFACYLESAGVVRGDRVALIVSNCEEFVITVFAVTKLGAVAVPVNNMLKAAEFEYILNDCGAKLLVTAKKFISEVSGLRVATGIEKTLWVDEAPQFSENDILFADAMASHVLNPYKVKPSELDDLAIIFYTSGTTGKPKGAMISYRNIFSNLAGANELFKITHKDRFIVYLPMFHAFTFTVMTMLPFYSGSSFVIIRNLMPFSNILKQTLLKRVTVFLGVPDIYNALIRADLPWYFLWFNSIRAFISGAFALSRDTVDKFKQTFKRATMLEGYGLSECSPAVACNTFEDQKTGSVGRPLPGYEAKVVNDEMVELPAGEVGELIIKGDCVMQGYLNRPEATEETIINGWLRTGDLAKIDEEGYIFIVDRMKDLIISKGLNIYPREIEEALMLLNDIKAAAVIGIPDPHSGEVPVAYIELEEDIDADTIDQSATKAELKKRLANFKIPKHIHIVDELPKNAAGKVLKRVLKEQLRQES
jgi:long-chain acyl-CoA synthetase